MKLWSFLRNPVFRWWICKGCKKRENHEEPIDQLCFPIKHDHSVDDFGVLGPSIRETHFAHVSALHACHVLGLGNADRLGEKSWKFGGKPEIKQKNSNREELESDRKFDVRGLF